MNRVGGVLLVYTRLGTTILAINKCLVIKQYCSFRPADGCTNVEFSLEYRSPNSRPEAMDALPAPVRQAEKNAVILGDYNLPNIDWEKGTATGTRLAQFLEACKMLGWNSWSASPLR